MIIEMRTDSLIPLTGAVAEERIAAALPSRLALSPLAAFWRTEVGELNQLISLWPYADQAELERVRREEAKLAGWPTVISEFIIKQESRVLVPAPFSPPLKPQVLGGLVEIRIYNYPKEAIPLVIQNWTEILTPRLAFSPLVGAFHAEGEHDTEWVHIWAYADAGERERVRAAATKAELWPPSVVDKRLKRKPLATSIRMKNMLVVPTNFSPLR